MALWICFPHNGTRLAVRIDQGRGRGGPLVGLGTAHDKARSEWRCARCGAPVLPRRVTWTESGRVIDGAPEVVPRCTACATGVDPAP